MSAAAFDAGGRFSEWFYPGEFSAAGRAFVKVAADGGAAWERKVVGAFFVGKSEVAAGVSPFFAVRLDAALSGPVVGEQVREFVTESAVDFRCAELSEAGVEGDERFVPVCHPGCAFHAGVPTDLDSGGEGRGACRDEEFAGFGEQFGFFREVGPGWVDADVEAPLAGRWRRLRLERGGKKALYEIEFHHAGDGETFARPAQARLWTKFGGGRFLSIL